MTTMFTHSFIRVQIKENIKAPRHWPLCGEFTGTGEFPAQRASNAENVSIWWRHHEEYTLQLITPGDVCMISTMTNDLVLGRLWALS